MIEIDDTDFAIIDVLKKNARLSTRDISKRSGVPPATVHKRMKRLEKEKVIERYSVKLNPEKLGKHTTAYVLIHANRQADYRPIVDRIKSHSAVEDVAILAGAFDGLVKVRVGTMKDLDDFVMNFLRKFPEIDATQTLLVFRQSE